MIDFTRRRFLFGLAAAPLVVPAVKHFVMPQIDFVFETEQKYQWDGFGPHIERSADGESWEDHPLAEIAQPNGTTLSFPGESRWRITWHDALPLPRQTISSMWPVHIERPV